MVFSFFKKDPKDPKRGSGNRTTPANPRTGGATEVTTRPTPKPIGRPLDGPVNRSLNRTSTPSTAFPLTETALPDRERARNRARETAAKIDAIESEMARDILRGLGRAPGPAPGAASPPGQGATPPIGGNAGAVSSPGQTPQDLAESAADTLAGDIDAIEINTSAAGSVIDETAILFSNGQIAEAEAVLRAGLRGDDLGGGTRLAWLMLFELLNQRGDKAAFEQLTMDYVLRFEDSPPAWTEYTEAPPAPRPPSRATEPPPAAGAPGVRLPESIDAGIVSQLEQLRTLTAAHAAVQIDVSDARRIDFAGADLLLRVLGAFKRSKRELTVVGAASLAEVLSRTVESGRRDPSDSAWMLWLEILRMLDEQEAFEETAIQYCVTFERSPPSWEPPFAGLKVAAATSSPAAAPAASPASPFELRGVVDGEGEPQFGRLFAAARNQERVIIDCRQLRRLAFSAGSALLGLVRKLQQGGASVELHNVNALVVALLNLLGITLIAPVHQRQG